MTSPRVPSAGKTSPCHSWRQWPLTHPLMLLSPMALISVDLEDSPSLDGPRVSPLTWHSSAGVPYSFAE